MRKTLLKLQRRKLGLMQADRGLQAFLTEVPTWNLVWSSSRFCRRMSGVYGSQLGFRSFALLWPPAM